VLVVFGHSLAASTACNYQKYLLLSFGLRRALASPEMRKESALTTLPGGLTIDRASYTIAESETRSDETLRARNALDWEDLVR
jgi:hypothetical protein